MKTAKEYYHSKRSPSPSPKRESASKEKSSSKRSPFPSPKRKSASKTSSPTSSHSHSSIRRSHRSRSVELHSVHKQTVKRADVNFHLNNLERLYDTFTEHDRMRRMFEDVHDYQGWQNYKIQHIQSAMNAVGLEVLKRMYNNVLLNKKGLYWMKKDEIQSDANMLNNL